MDTDVHASLNDNPERQHGFEPLRVDGRLPTDLNGTVYRTGPGLPERFGRRVAHAFEADGLMCAIRLADGSAQGAVRAVAGPRFMEEEAAGRPLYSTAAGWWRRTLAALTGKSKATGNTSMWRWQDELYALMEGDRPVRIDPDTLATCGPTDLGGVIPRAFSAHPRRVEALKTTFNFGARPGRTMEIDVFALPDEGPARRLVTVDAPFNAMVHDFVATQTHIAILVCPAELQLFRAFFGIGGMESWFRFRPERGTHIIVIPLADPEDHRTIEVDPFFFFHTANAWSDGARLTADLAWYPNLDALADIGTSNETAAPPHLHRCTLDLESGAWRCDRRLDLPFEFPQVHPGMEGGPTRTVFGNTESGLRGHIGIARIDDGADPVVWMPDDGGQASEPMLVRRSAREGDVWVTSLVHDGDSNTSYLAVLDGDGLDAGPVARVWFDQTIPLTFHGVFARG